MKVYILKGAAAAYAVTCIVETKEYWLVPKSGTNEYDIFAKRAFDLTIEDVEDSNLGFTAPDKQIPD